MTHAIVAENLVQRFGRTRVLDDVAFAILRGSICGLLGPNGAGKTTTMLLMGLAKPTAGRVRVLEMDPLRHPLELRNRVGFVPDQHHMFANLTARQILSFVAGIYTHWDKAAEQQLLECFKIPLQRRVKHLSRGEAAKLVLTVALAHRAELLILDEPTVGLDPQVRHEFTSALMETARTSGQTVLFSTHILSDLDTAADRLVIINKSRILAAGPVDELRGRYAKVSFVFRSPPPEATLVPGALHVTRGMREWVALFPAAERDHFPMLATELGAEDYLAHQISFEELFLELLHNGTTPCAA